MTKRIVGWIKWFSLVLFVSWYTASCIVPHGTSLASRSDNSGNGGSHGEEDRTRVKLCEDRDSCQDECDKMFKDRSEEFACYELSYDDIKKLAKVHDAMIEVHGTRSTDFYYHLLGEKDDLEDDIEIDDLELFLDIGRETLVEAITARTIIEGYTKNESAKSDAEKVAQENAQTFLEWIAESSDVASVFLAKDEGGDFEILQSLFEAISPVPKGTKLREDEFNSNSFTTALDQGVFVKWSNHSHGAVSANGIGGISIFDIEEEIDKVFQWITGFIFPIKQKDSFMTTSVYERNREAFEWGHKTLTKLCEKITGERSSRVETKTCLQVAYCLHRASESLGLGVVSYINTNNYLTSGKEDLSVSEVESDGIFDDLDRRYDDLVGHTRSEYCTVSALTDENRMEDAFEQ